MNRKIQTLIRVLVILSINALPLILPFKTFAKSGYPYTNTGVDPWGFYKLQCTSYAAWAINDDGLAMSNGMAGPNGSSDIFGNAEHWDDNASYIGFNVSNTPSIGSIAVWDPYQGGAGAEGHVAYVESTNGNGTVNISEYNWYGGNKSYSERSNKNADHYIHFTSPGASTLGKQLNGDFNGDGFSDLLFVDKSEVRFVVQTGNNQSFRGNKVWRSGDTFSMTSYDEMLVGDLNGDDKDDVIAVHETNGKIKGWESTSTGSFSAGTTWGGLGTETFDVNYLLADMNSDGYDDFIEINMDDGDFNLYMNNQAGGFISGVSMYQGADSLLGYEFHTGDVDGDGDNDILGVVDYSEKVVTWSNNGNNTLASGAIWIDDSNNYTGYDMYFDFMNDDQYIDLIGVSGADERIVVWESNGSSFNRGVEWFDGTNSYSDYKISVGKVNNDGLADIIGTKPDSTRTIVWESQSNETSDNAYEAYLSYNYQSTPAYSIGDQNGDGIDDVLETLKQQEDINSFVTQGEAFQGLSQLFNGSHDYTNSILIVANLNGDAYDDIIGIDRSSERFLMWENNGNGAYSSMPSPMFDGTNNYTGYKIAVADVNGDGYDDVVGVGRADERFVVWRNQQNNTLKNAAEWYNGPNNYNGYVFYASDVDGDGRADMIGINVADERMIVWKALSNNSFKKGKQWFNGSNNYSGYTPLVGDVDNDVLGDVIFTNKYI